MMECNREEGLRAGQIALTKLKKKDFRGAQRIALKAQRLYPELENLSQLLAVCEVHCAAEAEINGNLDWYGILQVEATANDEVITKQYCKLSCLLHPDKNTLPGAEAAFKLVCIAHKILCDHMMRLLYDIKTQHAFRKMAKKATHLSDSTHANKGDAIGHMSTSELILVFRTICPHCQKQFLFYQKNIFVRCDGCGKTFFAFNLHEEAVPLRFLPPSPYNAQVSPEMFSCHPNQYLDCTKLRSTGRDMDARATDSRATMNGTQTDEHVKWDDRSCDDGEGNFSETEDKVVQLSAMNQINSPVAAIDKDPTESMALEPNLSREDACAVSNANTAGSSSIQRFDKRKQDDGTGSSHSMDSCNNKRQRIYDSFSKAKSSDDTMCNENAASAENQSSDHCTSKFDNPEEGNTAHEDCQQIYRKHTSDIATQWPAGKSMIACACTEIFNFETYRDANRFAVGQIWALYDNLDVMPRFYARIMHFDAHNHKIHLTWLEHEATNEEEESWTNKKLPIACGSFRLQPTVDTSQDRFMFSHIVAWTEGKKGNSYDIYPNKGEVWALYKGWSKQWSSDTDNHRSCEYEVVEILSNMSADDGATVIPLVKIKDFVSLFARSKGMSSFFIPSSELLRFSHSISFYRTNGNEKNGVPRGFLELDTACLPADLGAAFSSVTLVSYMFLGNMTGCVFADFTTGSADNKMECGDSIARKENSLEQNVCHSISTDDTDDISTEQNTSEQKKAHDGNELGTEDTSTMSNGDMEGRSSISDPADPNIVDRQKSVREDASAVPDALNMPGSAKPSSAGGKTDGDARINVVGTRLMPDPVDLSITGRRNMHRQNASTVPTGAGSSGTQNSVRRKTYADGNICLNTDTNKRPRKDNFPSDVNMSCKQVCDDNVTNAGIQSDPPHVSGGNVDTQQKPKVADISDHQVNIKDKATETDSDQDNIMEEAPQTVSEKVNFKEKATETDSDQDNIMEEAPQTVSEKKPSYSEQVTLPDPDFFNFEKIKDIKNVFEVGQIWALYDNLDGMPRYYARIKHFDASNFKIHLTWLEYVAMDEDEENWTDEELPTACGNFRLVKGTDISEDKEMFSHIASWTKGKKKNSYVIYPNKGDVWALHKGWSMEWSSDADNHRSYGYEVVEVVSSMSANGGATVIPLVRIEGFVCLFATAKDKSSFVIPSSELLRFSHRIPFYRTKGNGKVGAPRGFLELDNACLPADLDAAFSSVTLDSYMSLSKKESSTSVNVTTDNTSCRMDLGDDQIAQKENHPEEHIALPMSTDNPKDLCLEQNTPLKKTAGDANGFSDCSLQGNLSPNIYTYPDSDFHKFEESRSCEKFERGQVWALYNYIDKLPNFYAWIKKVREEPFRVEVIWLEACPKQDQEKQWLEQDIPISCGTFKIRKWRAEYDTNNTFSHQVNARETGKKCELEILPQVGDIWAVYMNWAPDWIPCIVDDCEFAICEVVKCTEASTKLTFLAQVIGYRSVFKPDKQRGVLEVPAEDKLRFSHQIPYFRLTGEGGGSLRGFYELDSASVPDAFLYGDT